MNFIYLDFEYIEEPDRTNRHLICCVTYDFNLVQSRKFSLMDSVEEFKEHISSYDLEDTVFVGWAISGAEVPCLYQLMGYDWLIKTQWIDLWVEYKMFVLTHQDFIEYEKKDRLLDCIKCFELESAYTADKEDTLSIILYDNHNRKSKETLRIHAGTFQYTFEEMEKILFYCEQDVLILIAISKILKTIASSYGAPITLEHRLSRGEFCMLSGISYEAGRGFPMDVEKVNAVFSNRDRIKKLIQMECNNKSRCNIYEPKFKGPVKNKTLIGYSFSHSNFENYIKSKNLYDLWEKTESGRLLRTDEEYMDSMLSNHKDVLEPIYNARNTLKQLNSTDLSKIMSKEGYIKCPPFPFHQKTSRSSPKPKLGFILNLSPWLRMLIRPRPGRAFVSIDFKSQEILIAAVLAKDPQLLDSYLNDYYMSTAIKTGFAPEGATKKTHPHIRNPFKGISLGTIYGLQVKSLTYRFMSLNNEWSYEEAFEQASNYFRNNKEVYYKYWEFVAQNYDDSMNQGYFQINAESGWIYFMRPKTRSSQIQNLPCQSFGAEMLRYSHNPCVREKIHVITLHDALSFECAESEAVDLAKKVSKTMCDASTRLLGYDYMGTETKIYTHEKPYYDARGVDTYKLIMNELNIPIPEKFDKSKEIENIHLLTEVEI